MNNQKIYTWQQEGWPRYTYSRDDVFGSVLTYERAAGSFKGAFRQLTPEQQGQSALECMISTAMNTSAIEGEDLDELSIRSSIRAHLNMPVLETHRREMRADGVSAMTVEAKVSFNEPLSSGWLHRLHKMVLAHIEVSTFSDVLVGQYRITEHDMVIQSGPIGREVVHYVAPPSKDVPAMMDELISWCVKPESNVSGIEKAALAHLWFETIHPYDDGNGRIGRALAEKMLSEDLGFPSVGNLSEAIYADKNEYHQQLNDASKSLDVTAWVNWFACTAAKGQELALGVIDGVMEKARFWHQHENKPMSQRQEKAINKMFDLNSRDFGMTAAKYGSMTKCSKATATRDITELAGWGCFVSSGKGKGIKYNLVIPPVLDLNSLKLDAAIDVEFSREGHKGADSGPSM